MVRWLYARLAAYCRRDLPDVNRSVIDALERGDAQVVEHTVSQFLGTPMTATFRVVFR